MNRVICFLTFIKQSFAFYFIIQMNPKGRNKE